MSAQRARIFGAALLCAMATAGARATEWDASLDMRLVGADAPTSVPDGGLGVLRYGDNRDGLQLGRARLALSQDFGELLTLQSRCLGLGPARSQSAGFHRSVPATASLSMG